MEWKMNGRITIADLLTAKQQRRPIAAVSCYEYTTARLVAQTPVEMILVGDSAAQLMLGFDSTLPATMDFMVAITAAVRRAAPNVYLVADMPFLSYHLSLAQAIRNAGRFMTDAGAQMVKIEATAAYLDTLAVAYAAAGRFGDAITTAQRAVDLAGRAGQPQLVLEIETRLKLYQEGRAYLQSIGEASPHGS